MIEREMAEANKILVIRTGSHMYGTNLPNSDEDKMGVFIADEDYYLGLKTVEEVDFSVQEKDERGKNTKDALDYKLYEFKKYIKLACDCNPNIIEMLYVNEPNILFINDFGKTLLEHRELFPNQRAYYKFIGYAHSQKHKMIIKGDHYSQIMAAHAYLKELPNRAIMKDFEKKELPFLVYNKNAFIEVGDMRIPTNTTAKKATALLKGRIDRFGNRTELISKYGYDLKFGSHLVRLLVEGIELLKTGELQYPIKERQLILDVRQGRYTLKQVFDMYDELSKEIDSVFANTKLPHHPDINKINDFLKNIVKKKCGFPVKSFSKNCVRWIEGVLNLLKGGRL